MKNLLLVRHAKSSWESGSSSDFARPLNDRGMRDAPMMAKRLLAKKIAIDALVSSSANRALSTATYFAGVLGFNEKDIITIPSLYHANSEIFSKVISELPDALTTVAIFSHNPGITEYVNLMKVALVDNMPTCGIFGVHALTDNWASFAEAEKRFWMFDYPKNL